MKIKICIYYRIIHLPLPVDDYFYFYILSRHTKYMPSDNSLTKNRILGGREG